MQLLPKQVRVLGEDVRLASQCPGESLQDGISVVKILLMSHSHAILISNGLILRGK